MNKLDETSGVWLFYDGECPLCTNAAQAIIIRKEYGALHLVNARDPVNHNLVHEISQRGFDLDEGMVVYTKGLFYHGKDALVFMARFGDAQNIFTALCKVLLWSNFFSSIAYPVMRGVRNFLLFCRRIGKIGNLKRHNISIEQSKNDAANL